MKVMITGANGFLGQHLCRHLGGFYEIHATGKGAGRIPFKHINYLAADVSDSIGLSTIIEAVRPEVIIHAAAMSKPDECEQNKEQCDKINITGTLNVISAAAQPELKPHIIYISSDFVLGEGGPHDETAVPAPLNYYGESKLRAEQLVMQSGLFYTIVRPVFMYGATWEGMRPTFLHWVKQSLETGKQIKVVSDQQRTPTYVTDICKGIKAIIEKRAGGLFHLAGKDRLSPYDMAVKLAVLSSHDHLLIEPVTAETFKEPVQRVKEGGLIISKAKKDLDYDPVYFDEGLRLSGMIQTPTA